MNSSSHSVERLAKRRCVALYGGSFDPIHNGHLGIAQAVCAQLACDEMIFLPSIASPHKPGRVMADSTDRAEMVRLAIASHPKFSLSDYDLSRPGPTYTIDTVQHFRDTLGCETELLWIIGADSLAELVYWRSATELVNACSIVTVARPGSMEDPWPGLAKLFNQPQLKRLREGIVDTPLFDVSSTEIRTRVAAGKSIRDLVPPSVSDYLNRRKLYRPNS